jgi:uncharacterized protein
VTENQPLELINNREASRFEVPLGKDFAFIDYDKEGNVYYFNHTEVPIENEGQGIASKMTKMALEAVKAEGAQLVPLCPYTRAYLERHPEYNVIVVADNRA